MTQPTEQKEQHTQPKPAKVQKGRALLYLDTSRIIWYQEGFASILTLELPQDAIKHLEVINRDEIYTAIKNTVTQNKLPSADTVILLAAKLLFTQDLPKDPDVKKNQEALDKYLGIVPFEDVGYTTMDMGKATRVIAGNLEYPEIVKDALIDSGFNPTTIAPITVLGDTYANLATLDAKSAAALLSQAENVKKYALSPIKKFVEEAENNPNNNILPEESDDDKPNNMRVYLLGGVFGILLIVLGVMVYINILAPQPQPKPASVPTAPVTVAQPTPTISLENEESTVSAGLSELTAQIQYQTSADEIQDLQEDLEELGFEDVTSRSAGGVNTARTQVAFSDDVTQTAQDTILAEIRKTYSDAQVQQSTPTQFDVVIILGNN